MNRILQLLEGKTISIVGSGYVKQDMSEEIDSSDVVVRFNHFYNYNSGYVGKKVDIIFQTFTRDWRIAQNKNINVIREQKPNIFVVKRPDLYNSNVRDFIDPDIRIDLIPGIFDKWFRFTTGTCVLAYLAENLKNAKVKCYGFQDEEDWNRYINSDAKKYYYVKNEERKLMLESIKTLESLTITSEAKEIPNVIVIPVKKNSKGAPNKNRLLIRRCIDVSLRCGLPVHIVGDDEKLFDQIKLEYGDKIITTVISPINPHDDVTLTLRKWSKAVEYTGNIAIVQCTSPYLKQEWISQCLDALKNAPITATACELGFKPTALFKRDKGVYIPCNESLPAASVARLLLPHTIRITGAVEAVHTDQLYKNSLYDTAALKPIIIPEEYSLDVDTKKQLEEAVGIINNN